MKRVVCLLLCAVLLLGLLPAAALADGELQIYFEICNENGVVSNATRWPGVGSMYGDSIFFRAYTAETDGVAITGNQLCLYENNEPDTNGMLTWIPSGTNGYYRWDTHAAKAADPVFLATINGQKYKGRAQVHEAEVGWFSSKDKSISTALTYGFATDANVFYDGTEAVTVYLTADPGYVTKITPENVEKTNDGIRFDLEDRGVSEGTALGPRLKVTCPAGLSGELTLRVPVELCYLETGETWTGTYAVTFSKVGKKPGGNIPSQPGEPTAILVTIDGKVRTCWFGVGEFNNGAYHILHGSQIGGPEDSASPVMLAVGLWWKNERQDGSWDLTMLTPEEAEQVKAQAEFRLEFYPQSGQEVSLPAKQALSEIDPDTALGKEAKTAAETGMPAADCYLLEAKHEGTWFVEAVCETGKNVHTSCSKLTRWVLVFSDLPDCTTVEQINTTLRNEFQELAEAGTRRTTYFRVILRQQTYRGQIDVPPIPDSLQGVEIGVTFIGNGPDGMANLYGGICSNSVPITATGIRFIGAGKQDPEDSNSRYWEKWPAKTGNDGAENFALYGLSGATANHCSFTGYYYAMKLTSGIRLCGEYNTYTQNHIAWYLGEGNFNGGSQYANNCVFEKNDIAIQIKKFNLPPSFYAPSRCQFIDNTIDILNHSNRSWFIPGNYFEHNGQRATANDPATSIGFYPMIRTEQTGDAYYWDCEWLPTKDRLLLSNSLTGAYPLTQTPLTQASALNAHRRRSASL